MNNQIQLVLKSSTAEMSLNDQALGIYLTPELDGLVGLPEIRTTSGVNAGYDGGWTSAQNYDARSITIRGVIANEDVATVERLRKQLVSLAGQGKSEELTLDLVTEAGNAYTLQVRTIALEMSMQSVLTQQQFMLQLRADDPLIYDAGESEHEATLQVAQATGGFTIDFELPLAITGGSEESVVNNDGLEEVPTTIKMYGALHNPKIINQTNNEQMQVMTDLGYAEGAWHTPSEASEGTSISLANTPDSAPFSDIHLKGDTYQNGTPTPSAPVAVQTVTGENVVSICGKNIWTFASSFQNTSSSAAWVLADTAVSFQPGTYTFSCTSTASSNVNFITYKYADNVDHNIAFNDVASLTFESEVKKIAILLGGNVSISNIQLELGSATAYEPYQSQSYEVNLGKNLINPTEISSTPVSHAGVDVSLQSDGTILLNGTATGDEWVNIMGGDFSTAIYGISNIGQTTVSLTQTDGTLSASVSNGIVARVIHDNTNGYWAFFMQSGASYDNAVLKIQFEKGSTATDFAAYFTPIELCKIGAYQDYIYKSGGDWYVHKATHKIVLNGTENWSRWSTGQEDTYQTRAFALPTTFYGDNIPIYPQGSAVTDLAKSNMAEVRGTAWGNSPSTIALNSTANLGLQYKLEKQYLNYTDSMTSDELVALFKTWLGSHITSLYYTLATPTDTEITNAALIAQLDDLLNLSRTYQGQTNMADLAASGNMPAILNVSYFTEQDPDTRDELIIDSRLHTVTLNGLDIYHLIGEGSEFLMLEPGENRLSLQSDITGDNGYAVVSYKQGYLSI